MKKPSNLFSDRVDHLHTLTHDERADFVNGVMDENGPRIEPYVLLRTYLSNYAIILNMSDDGEDITYLLDGRFVIKDFTDIFTIVDHKVFLF